MVTGERRTVAVSDDVSLSVVVRGGRPDQRAFLLVHGLASNARLWDGVADALQGAGHSSVAVDQRGHGQSSRPDEGYDFDRVSDDLAIVVHEALGRPVVIAGQSWGGNVAIEFACRHPDLVAGVVCVDGGFIKISEEHPDWEAARREMAPPDFSAMTADELARHAADRFDGWPPSAVEAMLANFEIGPGGSVSPRLTRERHMEILRELWDHDPDLAAERVSVPTLVVAVEGEGLGRRDRVERFAKSLSDGSVVWTDAHHDVHAQRPGEVAALLIDFAREIDR